MAASMMLAVTPLAAQDNAATAPPPAAAADNIGPRELSNFSLEGRVTRPAEPVAQPQPNLVREQPARTAEPAARTQSPPAPDRAVSANNQPGSTPRQTAASDPRAEPASARQVANAASSTAGAASALPPPIPLQPGPADPASGFSPLPWIAGLLLLGAGAVIYFGRQRRRSGYATGDVSAFVSKPDRPAPAAPVPRPARTPAEPLVRRPEPRIAPPASVPTGAVPPSPRATPQPSGVVAANLRPWIELELEPSQAVVSDEQAAIAFDVTLFNSGSAPARDVAVEACLINAGQQQDVQLSEFYTSPGEVKDKIPAVAPMTRITLKSAVRLPREAVREYEVEGRKLFIPMVAVSSRYRWSSGEGQSGASFLVGSAAANDSAKLGPLRLDQGARGWKKLAARRYEKGIRR